MSETKFSKGPWLLSTVTTSSGICHKVGPFPPRREDGASRHACMYSDYNSPCNPADVELLANAHLIAAAPELYEALLQAQEYLHEFASESEYNDNETILKKARGEA